MSVDDPTEERECPLCLEKLEIDDLYFFPCTCKYQVCRFCWHRIRMDENGLCPACRKPYPEDPANFQPITPMEMQQKKKQKEKKKNIAECRKHLSAYRVLQRNLVYVVGLSPRIADPEILKRSDYFGKYGKVVKVAVGTLPSSQGNAPVNTAYVTFSRVEDALKTIQETNSLVFDGRMIKTSLGTTKYCSNFLRGQACNKQECMYLHEVASPELSFTKEDMHQGKHTEYEKKLLEKMEQQMEAASSAAMKELGERERLGPFPEDEAVSATQEDDPRDDDVPGTPDQETEAVSTESDSKPASSVHEDSIESDILTIDNIKIVDPEFPEEPVPVSRNPPSPPPSSSTENYDDDLGFDPFAESMKGLEEELIKESKSQAMPVPHRHENDALSKLMYGMGGCHPESQQNSSSSFSYNSMHNSMHTPFRLDYEQRSNDFSSSPYGSYQNGFQNHQSQSSHYQRQQPQPQEKPYYNSNSAFSNFFMPRHSTLPETPAYQPYRQEQPSYSLLSNTHETRESFKALLPNVNVSFVSPNASEARSLFSTSPNHHYGQQQNSCQYNRQQPYRGSGIDYGSGGGGYQQHSHMLYGSEPPGFSTASKYMTTPPPGFDSVNHNQRPN